MATCEGLFCVADDTHFSVENVFAKIFRHKEDDS